VLLEARVNIAAKFGETELVRYYRQLASVRPEVVPPPSEARIRQAALLTSEKDAHVLAAALACKADWLVTLDRRHLLTPAVLGASLPLHAGTPGDFLRALLTKS
jgi:predicted nucleic acid-binding protein